MRVKFEVSISFEVNLDDASADELLYAMLGKLDDAAFAAVMSPPIAPGLDEESYTSRIDTFTVAAPPRCERCGQNVYGRYCRDESCGFHFYQQGDSRGWGGHPKHDPEFAMQQGMAFGVDAYNEAMGYDTSSPGPCGHHCDSNCPRCGREED